MHVAELKASIAVEYEPTLQGIQVVIFQEYVPAGQGMHAAELSALIVVEYVPTKHSMHTAGVEVLVIVEYVPAEQGVYTAVLRAPIAPEYVPAEQAVQFDTSIESEYVLEKHW